MKIAVRPHTADKESEVVFEKKLNAKMHLHYMPVNLRSGCAIYKHGRLVDLKIVSSIKAIGRADITMTFTESEIYQLAKRCRRKQDDQKFISLIMDQDLGRLGSDNSDDKAQP